MGFMFYYVCIVSMIGIGSQELMTEFRFESKMPDIIF